MLDQEKFDAISAANTFAVNTGITAVQTGEGEGEAFLDIGPGHLNYSGMLHGGVYYTLADCAAGAACRTDGRGYVTLHGSMDFIRPVCEGRLTARARVEHRGRSICQVSVTETAADGTVCASGRYIFFCKGAL